ncbi:MAG TPA: hypothetical protein VFU12_10410 [Glycomyces sp.]|nr:hypothetical protein [Glycomyces sp.]
MAAPSFKLMTADIVSAAHALTLFGEALGCTERYHHPESLGSDELQITAWVDNRTEAPELADLLGVTDMLVVVFDPRRHLDADRYASVISRVITVSAEFLEAHPGARAVLGEDTDFRLLMRRLEDDRIALDEYLRDPEGLNYSSAFDDLVAQYPVTDLGTLDLE